MGLEPNSLARQEIGPCTASVPASFLEDWNLLRARRAGGVSHAGGAPGAPRLAPSIRSGHAAHPTSPLPETRLNTGLGIQRSGIFQSSLLLGLCFQTQCSRANPRAQRHVLAQLARLSVSGRRDLARETPRGREKNIVWLAPPRIRRKESSPGVPARLGSVWAAPGFTPKEARKEGVRVRPGTPAPRAKPSRRRGRAGARAEKAAQGHFLPGEDKHPAAGPRAVPPPARAAAGRGRH